MDAEITPEVFDVADVTKWLEEDGGLRLSQVLNCAPHRVLEMLQHPDLVVRVHAMLSEVEAARTGGWRGLSASMGATLAESGARSLQTIAEQEPDPFRRKSVEGLIASAVELSTFAFEDGQAWHDLLALVESHVASASLKMSVVLRAVLAALACGEKQRGQQLMRHAETTSKHRKQLEKGDARVLEWIQWWLEVDRGAPELAQLSALRGQLTPHSSVIVDDAERATAPQNEPGPTKTRTVIRQRDQALLESDAGTEVVGPAQTRDGSETTTGSLTPGRRREGGGASLLLTLVQSPHPQAVRQMRLLDGKMVIGRSIDADWRIDDPDMHVSRAHCTVTGSAGRFTITDTSGGGLFVDDAPRPLGAGNTAPLRDGMRLRLADYVMRVDLDAEAQQPAASAGRDPGFDNDGFFSTHAKGNPRRERLPDLPDPFEHARHPAGKRIAEPPARESAPAFDDPFTLDPADRRAEQPRSGGFDWDAPSAEPERERPSELSSDLTAPARAPDPPPAAQVPGAPTVQPGSTNAALAAYLRGLGLDPVDARSGDPVTSMEAFGREYRMMAEGLMLLLRKRAEEKSTARIAPNVVGTAEANPLKFMPTVEAALSVMIAERSAGFADAETAIIGAVRDLAEQNERDHIEIVRPERGSRGDQVTTQNRPRFKAGTAFFYVPRRMWIDVPEDIELRLSPKNALQVVDTTEIIASMQTRDGPPETALVARVGRSMSAVLLADEDYFRVQTLGSETQDLTSENSGYLRWDWRLTPRRTGRSKLRLRLSVKRDAQGEEVLCDTDPFERTVEVRIRSVSTMLWRFWRDNWKWILGGGLAAAATIAGWLFSLFGMAN